MRILILAAGYGTRLYPLTLNLPKPLITINKKPIINFLMDKINDLEKSFPIEEINIVTNNRFYKSLLEWKEKYNVRANIINDDSNAPEDRLGAVKDIKIAVETGSDDWLVMGGDNLFQDSLVDFVKFSYKKAFPCVGLYDIGSKEAASKFGVVNTKDNGLIERFEEKPKNPVSTLIATCIYFFPKDSLKFLDLFLSEEKNPDTTGQYIGWLVRKTNVYGYKLKGKWLDIGGRDHLVFAEKEFK